MTTYNSPWHARVANSGGAGWITVDQSTGTNNGNTAFFNSAGASSIVVVDESDGPRVGYLDNSPDNRSTHACWRYNQEIDLSAHAGAAFQLIIDVDYTGWSSPDITSSEAFLGAGIANSNNMATATRYSGAYTWAYNGADRLDWYRINNWADLGGTADKVAYRAYSRMICLFGAARTRMTALYEPLNSSRDNIGADVLWEVYEDFDVSAGLHLHTFFGVRDGEADDSQITVPAVVRYQLVAMG